MEPNEPKNDEMLTEKQKAVVSAVVGGAAGYGAVAATGLTAAGMVGSGAGIGTAAGPVGVVAGALIGLAGYGLYRAFWK